LLLPVSGRFTGTLSGSRHNGSQTFGRMEKKMEQLEVIGQFFGGLGIFFLGIGVLWFVSVYKEKMG
jgi:hypothetical protein